MKLLFDENPSPKLVPILNDIFPGSLHVYNVGPNDMSITEATAMLLAEC